MTSSLRTTAVIISALEFFTKYGKCKYYCACGVGQSVFISSETPLRVFECYLVLRRPFGINGLLGYEAVAPTFHVLMDYVHPAFLDAVPLIVMVWHPAAVLSTVKYQRKRAFEK